MIPVAAAPSPLRGWTRGHVPAHVIDAGRALADLVEQALLGVLVPLYDPRTHDRDGKLSSTVFARRREVWIHAVDLPELGPWPGVSGARRPLRPARPAP